MTGSCPFWVDTARSGGTLNNNKRVSHVAQLGVTSESCIVAESGMQMETQKRCGACLETFDEGSVLTLPCNCTYYYPCINSCYETGLASKLTYPPNCCGRPVELAIISKVLDRRHLLRFDAVKEVSDPLKSVSGLLRLQLLLIFTDKDPHRSSVLPALPTAVASGAILSYQPERFAKMLPHAYAVMIRRASSAIIPYYHIVGCRASARRIWWSLVSKITFARTCAQGVPSASSWLRRSKDVMLWSSSPADLVRVSSSLLTLIRCECGAELCYNCGKLYDSADTADQPCDCSERDREDDSDEDRSESEDSDEDEEMGEWPQYSEALDASGARRCEHKGTDVIEGGRRHGCLREVGELRECHRCQLQLCRDCQKNGRTVQNTARQGCHTTGGRE